ncbi:helix-turn-helix domain-containing protein [Salinibacterium sp. ZJ450]|uniref:helix-turn-helix domain-containing protein n=1 Tax=Salinibacterium sp. ZJ450 TaxID=2708338 RepID=UPI00142465C5|nr:helix-turn-helix domain-containing protein [Salinibacterium sp. ZJ450]
MTADVRNSGMRLDAELLARLANGATTAELQEYGANTGMNAVDRDLVAAAVKVRTRIDELEDRERALVRLSESVRDIAGLDAVDQVLQSIVSRSRRLLMADVAYFLTFDQWTGVALMHVSEGIMSDAFSRLKVEPGEGISGYIASSKRPSWTSDYLIDSRYTHTGTIDSATIEEGLRAILGVPVLRAGRVVGLLLAADRHEHNYRPQDAELLFSLAQHAGVLIENATVHAQDQQTVEELEEALQALRASEGTSLAILELQDRLMALLMNRGSLEDLASVTQAALGGTIVLCDQGKRELARIGEDDLPASEDGWNVQPLSTRDSTLGYMLHREDSDGDKRDDTQASQMLVRAASVGTLMVESLEASLSSSREATATLVSELLRHPTGDRAALLRATVSTDITTLDTVLLAVPRDETHRYDLFRAAHRFAEQQQGLSCQLEGCVLLWLPGGNADQTAQHTAAALTTAVDDAITVGASRLSVTPATLGDAVREARNTASALIALGRIGHGSDSSRVAPFPTILANSTSEDLDLFIRDVLGQLLDHDQQNRTELLSTLESVYRHSSNVVAAAESLYLHPNTVHQRLARIDQITGVSWRDTDVAIQRQLALRIIALRATHITTHDKD